MSDDLHAIEERMAHLQRAMDDLSDVAVRHESEIARLSIQVDLLMRREANREGESQGGVVLGDERPPHY